MSQAGIRLTISSKTFPGSKRGVQAPIISNLSLVLGEGEFVCLVGPSGCGKSTLLNIVAGLDADFQGSIDFGLGRTSPRIGYVFQEPRLLPWRTVRQNIELALPPGEGDPALVAHLLDAMELSRVQHQYPERLSLGMSRRVALVRAFAIQPTLLLMDEPFVSLDAPIARSIRQLLIRVWQERPHTVLFVTHDLREAICLADRLAFLCAAPTSIVHEVLVDVPRGLRDQEDEIDAFRRTLLQTSPQLAQWV